MSQPFRIAPGNGIDRTEPLRFSFDGRRLEGYAGDTLASALLANGVRLIARSFKYHRPRGIVGIGAEEPTALVTVGEGANVEPNTRATLTELHEGLVAASQNCWPSAGFDLGAINDEAVRKEIEEHIPYDTQHVQLPDELRARILEFLGRLKWN